MPLIRAGIVAALVLLVDRITKIWVVEVLDLRHEGEIAVWPPFLNLTMAWNDGVNFGLFGSGTDTGRYILVGIALAVVVGLLLWARNMKGWLMPVFVGAIVGGALGNVWDRLQWGAVADFLNMSCCGIDNPFAFNIADVAIFVGAFGLILFSGSPDRPAKAKNRR